jgi:hypothetical protein
MQAGLELPTDWKAQVSGPVTAAGFSQSVLLAYSVRIAQDVPLARMTCHLLRASRPRGQTRWQGHGSIFMRERLRSVIPTPRGVQALLRARSTAASRHAHSTPYAARETTRVREPQAGRVLTAALVAALANAGHRALGAAFP